MIDIVTQTELHNNKNYSIGKTTNEQQLGLEKNRLHSLANEVSNHLPLPILDLKQ
jgi:hypothetical protein